MSLCEKGLIRGNMESTNETKTDIASVKGIGYRNLHFQGSFCPPDSGIYRIIFEGAIDPVWEPLRSEYIFNGIKTNNRTSAYHSLYPNTCYPYYTNQAILYSEKNWGELYFQKLDEEKRLITSNYSLTCMRLVCKAGSMHPDCFSHSLQKMCIKRTSFCHILICLLRNEKC